jgi:5-methylcytosine-specific restriction protein B
MFSWIPIHREAIHRILELRNNEKELLTILGEMEQQGLKVISLQDEGADGQTTPLAEIDPFTFLASFNRRITDENRRDNWTFLKTRWKLQAPVPDDSAGIPLLDNRNSWLFPYAAKRGRDHVEHLWKIAALAAQRGTDKVDEELFNRCLKLSHVGIASLTIGFFWINPEQFLPADHKTIAYGKAKGITTEPEDYQGYWQWLNEMTDRLGRDYPRISHAAHLFARQDGSQLEQREGTENMIMFELLLKQPEVNDHYINLRGTDGKEYGSIIGKRNTIVTVIDSIGREFQMKRHGGNQLTRCAGWFNTNKVQPNTRLQAKFDLEKKVLHLAPVSARPPEGGELHEAPPESLSRQFWTLSAGTGGEYWEEFYERGIAAIGWDGTPDLRQFKSKDEVRQKLQELWPGDSQQKINANTCWQFVHDIEKGDIIFAKQGFTRLLGYGVVEGDYEFDATRTYYKHVRKVKWLAKGEWEMPEESKMAPKALTDITPYPDFIRLIASKVGLEIGAEQKPGSVIVDSFAGSGSHVVRVLDSIAYWWLNANPKIWNFEETPVGQKQTYTSHNEKGNKRQKYKYFEEVKPGDLVVGYVTSPQKEVVAVCKITKGLHQTEYGEEIEFEKVEQLAKPIAYETLQDNPDLANSEPLINNQGSLFKLTEQEYDIIRSLIDETNIPVTTEIESYDKQKAMKGLFLAETQFDEMLAALKEKKNVVLQGAPGVGKTYVAKRLAYALIESNDPHRIEMIQFHQSYSYEDFIQGFRPTPKGHFDLKYGIFHQFCRRAQREDTKGKPYVFIIDEINRGNLSKILGELMMLIEPDKRGKEHAIPLAYSQDADEKFYIPENLHLIGMMNTADRSLAMVDYALRRRFRFITLRPEFASKAFQEFLIDAGAWQELVNKIVTRMNALNEVIAADTKNLGPGYQIGHSYFCPRNGIKLDDDWYRRVIESEIVPLIQEYWFDNEQKVKEQRSALLA